MEPLLSVDENSQLKSYLRYVVVTVDVKRRNLYVTGERTVLAVGRIETIVALV